MAQRQGIFKSVAVVGGLISLLAVATYPVIVHPKMYPEKYRKGYRLTLCQSSYLYIYIVEKLERKLLWISRFVAIHKRFLHEIWGRDIFWLHQQAICKSFLYKNLFSTNSRKLSSAKVSRYTVLTILLLEMSKIFRETSCTVYAKYQCVKWPPARAVLKFAMKAIPLALFPGFCSLICVQAEE